MSTLKELKTNIQKVIQKMKVSLTNKGVDVTTTPDTLNALADKIGEISQGQVPSSTVYSVDLGIYGYSEEQLKRVKHYLDQSLIGIWETPDGQAILKNQNINQNSYQNLILLNNNIGPILLPPITIREIPPSGNSVYSPIFRGDINVDIKGRRSVEAMLQDCHYEHELPGGNWTDEAQRIDNFITYGHGFEEINLVLKSATSISSIIALCRNLKSVTLKLDVITYIGYTFSSLPNLEYIHITAPKLDSLYYFINGELPKIKYVYFDIGSGIKNIALSNTKALSNWGFLLIKNISSENIPSLNFIGCESWGVGSEENRQSLIDTLITYSYDRTLNGLNAATVQLASTTLALLTDEEITTINNKGYTLAS